MLARAISGLAWRQALRAPACRAAAAGSYSTDVLVPPMGDSISEGMVSAVLKRGGEVVQENETIAQIETDKVTIDIKSPADGVLVGLLLRPDDTVVPGQLVARVDESAAPAGMMGGAPAAPAASSSGAPAGAGGAAGAPPAAAAAPAAAGAGGHHGRSPAIRFPPRRAPDGRQLSMLPAAETSTLLASLTGGGGGGGAAPGGGRAAPAAAAAPGKAATLVTRLNETPSRREMTEAEMDAIMLGGAS